MPGLEFQPEAAKPCYKSKEEGWTVAEGDRVRIKVMGTRIDAKGIFSIATMADDCLGLI